MENFFTPWRIWPGGGPRLHFIVPLGDAPGYRGYVQAHAALLARHPGLGAVPGRWAQVTLLGIPGPADGERAARLADAAREALRGARPFVVQLGPVWPGATTIGAAVYPERDMADLAARLAAAAGADREPGDEGFRPRAVLAYARADFDAPDLTGALVALRPERVDVLVDRVLLVGMRRDPVAGSHTWETVAEFRLGAAPAASAARVAELYRRRIRRGRPAAGDPLPPGARIARDLRVSPATARAAVRTLADEGWVRLSPGRGARVAPRAEWPGVPRALAPEEVPDGTDPARYEAAFRRARASADPFVCVFATEDGWRVELDLLTAPGSRLPTETEALLADLPPAPGGDRCSPAGAMRSGHVLVPGLATEPEARTLAAALHAAATGGRVPAPATSGAG